MVKVKVELYWGKQWSAKEGYYKETPGEGVYVTVGEHYLSRNSFRGCPLGRTDDRSFPNDEAAIKAAIADFVRRGRGEYLGTQPLTEAMIEVQETKDYRKKT